MFDPFTRHMRNSLENTELQRKIAMIKALFTRRQTAGLALFFLVNMPIWAQVGFKVGKEKIAVEIDGEPFTTFYIAGESLHRPYLYPLRSAEGIVVTRSFPAGQIPGESIDHPHQAGVFYGHGEVNGYNYWSIQNVPEPPSRGSSTRGRIVLRELGSVRNGDETGSIDVVLDWLTPTGQPLLIERRTMTFYSHPELRIIDFDFHFQALDKVVFGDTKEGTFAVRVASALEERQPGRNSDGPKLQRTGKLMNAQEQEGEEKVWGRRSQWVDYSGLVDGRKVGVVMMDHPQNPRHPTYWHSRAYGLHSINPFGVSDFLGDETANGSLTLEPNGQIQFRYRLVVHPGASSTELAKLYEQYASVK